MKKIAYIELDTHAEVASSFRELISDSAIFSVDYYFSEKILKLLQLSENQNVIKCDFQNLLNKISKKNYDLVIIGTAHRYFSTFYKISKYFNCAVICHNLNFTKLSEYQLFKKIFLKEFRYRLKLLLKEGLLLSPKFYKMMKHKLVLDEALSSGEFTFLPIYFTKNFTQKNNNESLKIAVPGTVSQQRRDYEHILENLEKFKSKTEVVFLGTAGGKELEAIKNFEKAKPESVEIKYFTNKVSQENFDAEMKTSDVLWCPIKQETVFFSTKEIYGKTKMSGNIGDAIKFGKVALFPQFYPENQNFIFSEEENLEAQFQQLKVWKPDFSDFDKNEVRMKLEKVLESML